ncbi:MAG: YkgJ family cysteine cluster protein [Thermodesulfobacteriota bacterium]
MYLSDRCFYFFDQGLRFECQRCGACCTGEPGTVYVAPGEVGPIAAHLGMGQAALVRDLLYPFRDSYSIKEDARGNCLLYSDGCRIYPVRPVQCRTWPFWFKNLRSRYAWKQAASQCPGIGKGPVHTRKEILALLDR